MGNLKFPAYPGDIRRDILMQDVADNRRIISQSGINYGENKYPLNITVTYIMCTHCAE